MLADTRYPCGGIEVLKQMVRNNIPESQYHNSVLLIRSRDITQKRIDVQSGNTTLLPANRPNVFKIAGRFPMACILHNVFQLTGMCSPCAETVRYIIM